MVLSDATVFVKVPKTWTNKPPDSSGSLIVANELSVMLKINFVYVPMSVKLVKLHYSSKVYKKKSPKHFIMPIFAYIK